MAELKKPAVRAESGQAYTDAGLSSGSLLKQKPPCSNSGWARLLGLRSSLCFWQHGVIFLIACLILISRRPDAIFHAQFYAEDGHTWFADEYNYGWWSGLWRTYEGYHHLFMRLGAALALLVPLALAPLVMNLIAIGLQALVVNLLLSMRSSAWGSLGFRAILAAVFLALPNTLEMLNNISQDQWPLTLCAFLLLVAQPPKSVSGKVFDLSILLLCGLTGPQCIFLLPIALFLAWKDRNRWPLAAAGVLALTCAVQGWGLLHGGFASRPHGVLGANPEMLVRIVAGQVFLGTLLGANTLAVNSSPHALPWLLCTAILGTVIAAFCFAKSGLPMKLFALLTAALFAVSLISPTAYPPAGMSMWQQLARADGVRYWYFPCLAFAWLLLWGFRSGGDAMKVVSVVLLCVMCFTITFDWRVPPLKDLHFAEAAQRFEAAPAGTSMTFPQNPAGWDMQLVKHSSH